MRCKMSAAFLISNEEMPIDPPSSKFRTTKNISRCCQRSPRGIITQLSAIALREWEASGVF